jgi:hypothetical protein
MKMHTPVATCSFGARAHPPTIGLWPACLASGSLLLTACSSTNVLVANFDSDTVGGPPALTQMVGTVTVETAPGTVTIAKSPLPDLPSTQWARIGYPGSKPAALKGNFSPVDGPTNYDLTVTMFITSGSGIVTVQFEAANESPTSIRSFMHIDLMPEGDVRIDDAATRFGHFPKDVPFVLTASLNITANDAKAHVALSGAGATGATDVNIDPVALPVTHTFGAVRFWQAYDQVGQFFVDNIVVARKPN